jgi:hypothetical protein
MRPRIVISALSSLACLAACEATPVVDEPHDEASHAAGLTLTASTTTATDAPLCADPPASTTPVNDVLPAEPTMGAALDGQRLRFAGKTVDRAAVRISFEERDTSRQTPSLEEVVAGRTVLLTREPVRVRDDGKRIYVSSNGKALADVELRVTYGFGVDSATGRRGLGLAALDVVPAGGGDALDHHVPAGLGYAATPGSCQEQALVQFGPFPWDMPALKWPTIQGCSESRCVRIALSWLRLHHNAWRATQMMAFLASKSDAEKSFYWTRPGTDADGNAVSLRSSPEYWYGSWDKDRYLAVKEAIGDLWTIVREAKTGTTNLRLQCPNQATNPGNVCFTAHPLGHHFVKGWINFCSEAFTEDGCNSSISDTVDEVMHHEPLHHVFVHLDGIKALTDHKTHGHGNTCLSDLKTEPIYCESMVRHMATTGSCNHRDKGVTTVDAHAQFVRAIGTMVRAGDMTHWPMPADPTPHPPDCVGPLGCLCDEVPWDGVPDGDATDHTYCEDDEQGPATCQKTKFNASETVGICTSCADKRGPGCPCDDLSEPCDVGFCWGDDTGNGGSTGTCWNDPPPSWACLADCEALLGNGAFCMHDHPDHARCVPVGTSLPEASNCWWDGGHMDPQELACTTAPECGVAAGVTCQQLGYPDYFVCDGTLRCVPQP